MIIESSCPPMCSLSIINTSFKQIIHKSNLRTRKRKIICNCGVIIYFFYSVAKKHYFLTNPSSSSTLTIMNTLVILKNNTFFKLTHYKDNLPQNKIIQESLKIYLISTNEKSMSKRIRKSPSSISAQQF